jgi:hypothetical protein
MRAAGEALLARHPSLRVAFTHTAAGDLVQVVVDGVTLPWRYVDLTVLPPVDRAGRLAAFLAEDECDHFDAAVPPLVRMALVRLTAEDAELVLTVHHALLDGWSIPLLTRDLVHLYGASAPLPAAPPYRDFPAWLSTQDRAAAAEAWAAELAGVEEPTLLAPAAATPIDPPDRRDRPGPVAW